MSVDLICFGLGVALEGDVVFVAEEDLLTSVMTRLLFCKEAEITGACPGKLVAGWSGEMIDVVLILALTTIAEDPLDPTAEDDGPGKKERERALRGELMFANGVGATPPTPPTPPVF